MILNQVFESDSSDYFRMLVKHLWIKEIAINKHMVWALFLSSSSQRGPNLKVGVRIKEHTLSGMVKIK